LGCAPALGLGLLPQAIRSFQKKEAAATFEISTMHSAELVEGLRNRELDIIVTFDTGEHPGVTRREIGHTELAHLSRRKTVGPVRLDRLPSNNLIVLDARDPAGALLDAELTAPGGPTIETRIVVQTHYVAYSLSENGCGDAIVDL